MPDAKQERFEILLEGVNSSLKLLAEGHESLNEKFDALDRKVDGIATDMSVVKIDVAVLKKDVRVVKDHLGLNGGTPSRGSNKSPRRLGKKR